MTTAVQAPVKLYQFNKAWEKIAWSYLGGAVTAAGGYALAYAYKLAYSEPHHWNWKLFGLLFLSGLLAPLFKAANPFFKEFGISDLVKPFVSRATDLVASNIALQEAKPADVSSTVPPK